MTETDDFLLRREVGSVYLSPRIDGELGGSRTLTPEQTAMTASELQMAPSALLLSKENRKSSSNHSLMLVLTSSGPPETLTQKR